MRHVTTAAISPLPHYAALSLDKATHLRGQPEALRQLFNQPDARLVVFQGREGLVAPAQQPSPAAGDAAASATPDSQATWQDAELKWRPAYLQPAADAVHFGYLSGQRGGIVAYSSSSSSNGGSGSSHGGSPERSAVAAVGDSRVDGCGGSVGCSTISVSPENAVFLGLDPQTGAPVFAADLGPPPPLLPDASRAAAAAAAAGFLQAPTAGSTSADFEQPQGTDEASEAAAPSGDEQHCGAALDAWVAERGFEWVDVRRQGPHMAPGDAAIMALANGMLGWHRNSAFSGRDGAPLIMAEGGYCRKLIAPPDQPAKFTLYPRIDPAVIMAVTAGDHILLGHQARWVEGRYSLLAGFCEIGETLEQAVVRETREEAGVEVDLGSVRYHSSQPWPFPQSLMLGFTAAATPPPPARAGLAALGQKGSWAALQQGVTEAEVAAALGRPLPPVACNDAELADALWFSRHWLAAALSGDVQALAGQKFAVPGTYSLAGRIIHQWLYGSDPSFSGSGNSSRNSASSAADSSQQPAAGSSNPAESSAAEESSVTAESSAANATAAVKNAVLLDRVTDVQIDSGTFKYVLLRVSTPDGQTKVIVRGHAAAGYHNDILQVVSRKLEPAGFKVNVLGGGRISHDPAAAGVQIYGHSSAFGPAPHELSAALLRRWLPFHTVTTSYEGY